MGEILHHLGTLNYRNSWDFKDLRWCKISFINSITYMMTKAAIHLEKAKELLTSNLCMVELAC